MPRYCCECLPQKKTGASYGKKGETPTCCAMHGKAHGFINVVSTRCDDPECTVVNPKFGFEGGKGTHCGKHKLLKMVDVSSPRCEDPKCTKQPNFGFPGGKPTHCGKHKPPKMIDVVTPRCDDPECEERALYGIKGGTRTHCRKHKSCEMIALGGMRCDDPKCNGFAYYGMKGDRPTRCHKHKSCEMINVVGTRCKYDGCIKHPKFGFPGGKRTHCGKHKPPKMIDVVTPRCDDPKCKELAYYGMKGARPARCCKHKSGEMINVVGTRCDYDECNELAVYGIKADKKRIRCHAHKTNKMVLLSQRCTSCDTTCTKQKDKLCSACRQVLQLGASRKLLCIERRIIDSLILHGTIIDDERTKFNKSIGAECGGYRPDIYIDCGTFILIIEIDENQHRPRYISRVVDGVVTPMVVGSYSSECENVRMMSIVSKEQMPVYFIRYNPDKCTIDGKDINVSPEKRCEALRALIKSVMEGGKPKAWMTVTYMYYDGDRVIRTETPDLPSGF